ncbi:MAG: D-alanine--D-alanine ligase [Bacteroidia bacterium]|nr:D-alanine--D-alanine ligase [Bacteroidia bacterium]
MNSSPLHIAIVAGGDSSEYDISIKSANNILNNLDKAFFDARVVVISQRGWVVHDADGTVYPVNRHDFSWQPNGKVKHFDAVINSIHGTPGENGILPAYFELIGMPFTGCRSFSSALTFSKFHCNQFLKQCGINISPSLLIRKNQPIDINNIIENIGIPCFVKPNNGGSSCGTSRVNHPGEILPALERALSEDQEAIIEKLLVGTELTCGLFKTHFTSEVFPVTEIISKKEFFDYEAKYTPGMSDEITPARISAETARSVQDLSLLIYDLLDCRGVVRIDYILVDKIPWFLEVNTVPGMSSHSIVPKQASISGLSLNELFSILIRDAMDR